MTIAIPTTQCEIESVYQAGSAAVVTVFTLLLNQKVELENRVQELEARLAKDSGNSGKPPSSDGLKRKPQSLREPSNRTAGGQRGHRGTTLERSDAPDATSLSAPTVCEGCGAELDETDCVQRERRQVFDVPPTPLEVTEYQVESRSCPQCQTVSRGTFPAGVTAPAQYGPRVRSLLVYWNAGHFLPYARTCQIMKEVFGVSLSQGTLLSALQFASEQLKATETAVRTALAGASVANFDETGIRIEGKLHWLHSASAGPLLAYSPQASRGQPGMEAAGILPRFRGRAVHDFWRAYFKFDCTHALCNVHHLRELKYLQDQYGQKWAGAMRAVLIEMKTGVEAARAEGKTALPPEVLLRFQTQYDALLAQGETANPALVSEGTPRKGRPKQTPARNLLNRLRGYRAETLAFLTDFSVPFDNNRAERDVRMMKVQQKISGGFRAASGAKAFCRVRGYLVSAQNRSHPLLEALRQVFLGAPLDLVSDA